MKFTLEAPTMVTIRGVSDHEIRIGDQRWSRTIAVSMDGVIEDWPEKPIAGLAAEDFSTLLADAPELLVLGTGREHVIPPRELVFAFARRGIGFEVMTTPAAARTFNVLVGEGRQVAAVLYL